MTVFDKNAVARNVMGLSIDKRIYRCAGQQWLTREEDLSHAISRAP